MAEPAAFECYLTYRCNQRCLFCFVPGRSREAGAPIPFKTAAARMLAMRSRGCRDLRLLGGEPGVHPDLARLVAFARKAGYKRSFVFTNGTRFADPELARSVVKAGLFGANISVHSHRPGVHDRVTGVTGSFAKMIEGFRNLKAAGARMGVICVVSRLNARSLPATAEFFLELGAERFTFFFIKRQGRMVEEPGRAAAAEIRMGAAAAAVRRALPVFARLKARRPSLEHFTPCAAPDLAPLMTDYYPRGVAASDKGFTVHPDMDVRKLYENSYQGLVFLPSCAACRFRRGCPGIDPGYLEKYGPGEFRPSRRLTGRARRARPRP